MIRIKIEQKKRLFTVNGLCKLSEYSYFYCRFQMENTHGEIFIN